MRKSGLLVWWFVGVKPFLDAFVEGHVSVVSYVSNSSEPLSVLMELGFLLFGVGTDHADANPLLGTLDTGRSSQ